MKGQILLKKNKHDKQNVDFLMGLHHLEGGSTGPGYSLLHINLKEEMKLVQMTHLSSRISSAI